MPIIEMGGGKNPQFSEQRGNGINIDCRAIDGKVDIVADLEKPLPLMTGIFDIVYSQYLIEHISWRNVKGFISEVYRILKPGGKAVIITANLYEQCRKAVSEEWSENTSCMIFGDMDYEQNSHKNGMSPSYAVKLFREIGFNTVTASPLPWCMTDMLIEAVK